MSGSEVVEYDVAEDGNREIQLRVPFQTLMGALVESKWYFTHVQYSSHHATVSLFGEDFGPTAVDLFPSTEGERGDDYDIEDFVASETGGSVSETGEAGATTIIIRRQERPELSEQTGRDYVAEADACAEAVVSVAN